MTAVDCTSQVNLMIDVTMQNAVMNPKNNSEPEDEMRDEYDFSGGVRGKFYNEYMKGTNVVLPDADVLPQL